MDALDEDYAAELLAVREPPCLSLYQPTHRAFPEKQQDPIRFRNLVRALKDSLSRKYEAPEVQALLDPFLALAEDRDFWAGTLDGLAVLGSKDTFRTYRLQRPVPELVVVADSFHIKPLIRILQSADRFQILGVNREAMLLFEGNRDALDRLEPAQGVPRTIGEALGEELTEPHSTVSSYGGVGGSTSPRHHGHGGKETEVKVDAERFFRVVDRAVLEHHSRPSGLPLILAALPEYHQLFHEVSHNPFLVGESIPFYPEALSRDELRQRAWQLLEPRHRAQLAELREHFHAARSKDLGGDELEQVARAAAAGRVATLLIHADREIPGRIDAATGAVAFDELANPEVDDVLDDLAALVLRMKGQVFVVPSRGMPTETGIAAIYRY